MSLTKNDLGQIKNVVKETVAGAMESKPIKKILKDTVLEVIEPMMIVNQKEFAGINDKFIKIDERFDNLEATLRNQYPDKDYLTDKLADLAAEIGARIERKKEQDEKFKRKMIEILQRGSLATEEEILYLEKLI